MLSNLRRKLSGGKGETTDTDTDPNTESKDEREQTSIPKTPKLPPKTFLKSPSQHATSNPSRGRLSSGGLLRKLPSPWKRKGSGRARERQPFRGLERGTPDAVGSRIDESGSGSSSGSSLEEDEDSFASDIGEKDVYRAKLRAFYSTFNPEKISDVEYLLRKYNGNEDLLFTRLHRKYNVSEEMAKDIYSGIQDTADSISCEKAGTVTGGREEETGESLVVEQLALKMDGNVQIGISYAEGANPAIISLDPFGAEDLPRVLKVLFAKPRSQKLFGQLSHEQVFGVLEDLIAKVTSGPTEMSELACMDEPKLVHLKPTYRIRDVSETKHEWQERVKTLDRCIFELVDTERAYAHDLEVIFNLVLRPILDGQQGIRPSRASKSVLSEFFDNWQNLADFHREFYAQMRETCLRSVQTDLDKGEKGYGSSEEIFPGLLLPTALEPCMDVLDKFGAAVSTYKMYSARYAAGLKAYVQEHQTNKKLQKFLMDNCVGVLRGSSLETYLIKPIQRVCKYPLLLSAICKNLPAEMQITTEARRRVVQVGKRINSIVKSIDNAREDAERIAKLTSIQDKLRWGVEERQFSLVEERREFLLMDTVNVLFQGEEEETGRYNKRLAILCNDLLLLTVARKSWLNPGFKVYDVFDALPIKGVGISDLPREDCEQALGTTCGVELMFSYTWAPDKEHCILGFDSADQHQSWVKNLEASAAFNGSNNRGAEASTVLIELEKLAKSGALNNTESGFVRQMARAKRCVTGAFGKIHEQSALTIQCSFRGFLGRKKAKAKREEHLQKKAAVVTIQKAFRKYTRKRVKK